MTAARWPPGLAVTTWAYIWRITPLHRRELEGDRVRDGAPELPPGTSLLDVQLPESGVGPLLRRRYRARIAEPQLSAAELFARVRADPNVVAPGALARFQKVVGDRDAPLALGDEYTVRMPGPWDGPIRVIAVTPASFRFATLEGHLEAGQIEWRASEHDDELWFEIESWSRPGDPVSHLLHNHLKMAKEVQLHMWTSVLEKAAKLVGGRLPYGLDIETRVVPPE
jgi:Domain of unknown function (DUF1990)